MKHLKFMIYDNKADAYLPDWNAPNVATAVRLFQEACIKEGSPYNLHPGDYALMEVGTVCNITGDLTNTVPNIDHGSARQHLSRALLESAHNHTEQEQKHRDEQQFDKDHPNVDNLLKNISRGEALRAVNTKETTPS